MDKELKISYRKYDPIGELPAADRELAEHARAACATAWAPYSGFRVGAAARLTGGEVITASNQESPVFPAGVCAESNLLHYFHSQYPGGRIEALAISSEPGGGECYPCGICRQLLADTERRQGSPIRVVMTGARSATAVDSVACLLPFAFEGPSI